jgi:hypothetical protein
MYQYTRCLTFLADNIQTYVSGKEINEKCKDMKFQKVIKNDTLLDYNKYKFNKNNTNTMDFFVPEQKINKFLNYGPIIADVKILNNAKVFIEKYNKLKTKDIKITNYKNWIEDKELLLKIIKKNGFVIQYIKNQTTEICIEAIKQNSYALEFILNQTKELCLLAVKLNGLSLQFVKNKTHEICIEAVKQNGLALQFIENQTLEMCLEAVKQNGYAIKYVKNQTLEICKEAMNQNINAKIFIEEMFLH